MTSVRWDTVVGCFTAQAVECPRCGRILFLDRNGNLPNHYQPPIRYSTWCPMSGRMMSYLD